MLLSIVVACGGLVEEGTASDRQMPLDPRFIGGSGSLLGAGGSLGATGGVSAAGGSPMSSGGSGIVPVEPSNCELPIDIGKAVGTSYSGVLDQNDAGEYQGNCGGFGQEAVFLFTAPQDGTFSFDTRFSGIDTTLSVVNRDCYGITLGCNDDTYGSDSEVLVDLYQGQVVALAVEAYDGGVGPYTLNVNQKFNRCGENLGLKLGSPLVATPLALPNNDGESFNECGGSDAVAVFGWSAPAAGWFEFSTDGSNFDSVLTLRDGCGGTQIGCNDDGSDGFTITSKLDYFLEEGQELVIEVSSFNGSPYYEGEGPYLELNIEAH